MKTLIFEEIKQNWKERGFSCSIWQDPPQQEWNDFIHSEDEMIILVKGEIEIRTKSNKVRPKIGEEFLIPAKSTHSVKNTGSQPNEWYYGYRLTRKKS